MLYIKLRRYICIIVDDNELRFSEMGHFCHSLRICYLVSSLTCINVTTSRAQSYPPLSTQAYSSLQPFYLYTRATDDDPTSSYSRHSLFAFPKLALLLSSPPPWRPCRHRAPLNPYQRLVQLTMAYSRP